MHYPTTTPFLSCEFSTWIIHVMWCQCVHEIYSVTLPCALVRDLHRYINTCQIYHLIWIGFQSAYLKCIYRPMLPKAKTLGYNIIPPPSRFFWSHKLLSTILQIAVTLPTIWYLWWPADIWVVGKGDWTGKISTCPLEKCSPRYSLQEVSTFQMSTA